MYNLRHSNPTLTNCAFDGNSAEWEGGGMYNGDHSDPALANCTFSGNSAVSGGGVSCYESNATITNCILWGDTPDEIHVESGAAEVIFSDVQGGWPGRRNIDADPLWVSGPLGDFYLSQKRAGQDKNSPCVNKGDGTAKELGLKKYTTRTDHKKDRKRVDMGYHYPRH